MSGKEGSRHLTGGCVRQLEGPLANELILLEELECALRAYRTGKTDPHVAIDPTGRDPWSLSDQTSPTSRKRQSILDAGASEEDD